MVGNIVMLRHALYGSRNNWICHTPLDFAISNTRYSTWISWPVVNQPRREVIKSSASDIENIAAAIDESLSLLLLIARKILNSAIPTSIDIVIASVPPLFRLKAPR